MSFHLNLDHLCFLPGALSVFSRGRHEQTALLFAGQGAQVVGMGRDLVSNLPTVSLVPSRQRRLGYDLASDVSGPDRS